MNEQREIQEMRECQQRAERLRVYKDMLAIYKDEARRKHYIFGMGYCTVLYVEFGIRDIKEMPELMIYRPWIPRGAYWFNRYDYVKRIEILEKVIRDMESPKKFNRIKLLFKKIILHLY